jgi:V/A-type H+-transporting ATPase subunit E
VNQVQELERAIMARAQQLADQFAEQAQRTRDAVLRDAAERVRQREQREETIARAMGDRHYRQRVQAAELKLQSNLDRVRWNLVRGVESRLEERIRALREDAVAYAEYLRGLLREGAAQFAAGDLLVRADQADHVLVESLLGELEAGPAGSRITLDPAPVQTVTGLLLLSAGGRVRVDQTFEGRLARLRPQLQQVILERLFPASAEPGNLLNG